MKQRILFVCAVISLVAIASGCKQSSALPLRDAPFSVEESGYSIRYPEEWTASFLEYYNGTVFHPPGEDLEVLATWHRASETPVILVLAGPLESIPYVAHDTITDAETMLTAYLEWMRYAEDSRIGRARRTIVDGHRGLMADIRWTQDGVKVAGRVVAVYLGGRTFFLEAVGQANTWRSFLPTLDSMLSSVRLN